MTGRARVSQPRPGRRASFPDNLSDPGPAAAIAITARRFEIALAGQTATMDLTRLPGRNSLARAFTLALWQACQVGGPAGTVRTAMVIGRSPSIGSGAISMRQTHPYRRLPRLMLLPSKARRLDG
ncbi:hypothetical protein IMCC21224_13291 [Puniceibacterium sp. IMCC21224]|nr:hypothetical protein IMCC21224_13291 [Puniceibacterium sp. IMCC21224]